MQHLTIILCCPTLSVPTDCLAYKPQHLAPQHVQKCACFSSISLWTESSVILLQGITPLHLVCCKAWSGNHGIHEAEAIVAALLLSGANTNAKDSHVRLPPKVATQAWSSWILCSLPIYKVSWSCIDHLIFALQACTLLLGNK